MFEVRYRCVYREFWYDDLEFGNLNDAALRAYRLSRERRTPTIVVFDNQIVWDSRRL